jgi:ergothioneine biosynthesis protein EgtB
VEAVVPGPSAKEGPVGANDPCKLAAQYRDVRRLTERLCAPLAIEDYGVQSMPDASPAKWHLAHTTWFFETFLLAEVSPGYRPLHPSFGYLFNSYYNAVGERLARSDRGLLSRPTVAETYGYRAHVDECVLRLLDRDDFAERKDLHAVVTLGLNHEQQHQELILTDLKHAFSRNPLRPAYQARGPNEEAPAGPLRWLVFSGGTRWIGHEGDGFAYDIETPRHRVFLEPFRLASRLVTNGEFRAFMDDGGYERPDLWLSDGWAARQMRGWDAPLYWEKHGGQWRAFTLNGMQAVRDADPVCHVSFYEADAFARWAGARLPTEAEWETAAQSCPLAGPFLESDRLHPEAGGDANADGRPAQMFGEAWQWTASPFVAYPGFRPLPGALGEYNAKFTCNQIVLRGGSRATPLSHFRRSYRNFFPPEARWQFSGIRLAKDA